MYARPGYYSGGQVTKQVPPPERRPGTNGTTRGRFAGIPAKRTVAPNYRRKNDRRKRFRETYKYNTNPGRVKRSRSGVRKKK